MTNNEYLNFVNSGQTEKDLNRIKSMGSDITLSKISKDNQGRVYLKEWTITRK